MRKFKLKSFFSTVFILILAISLAACAKSQTTSSPAPSTKADSTPEAKKETKAKVEIVFQSWVTPNLTGEFYDGVIKAFEAANPDIKVKRIQPPAADPNADNYLKILLASGDFPDVISNATTQTFVDADALAEIAIDADVQNIKNNMTSAIKGKLYNLSATRQPQSLMFYNKKLFADAGITATPKSWAELMEVSAKLKAKNITPLIVGGSEWPSGAVLSLMTAPTIFKSQQTWYADRFEGKVKFTDPNWMEAAAFYLELVDKGYFNKGALSTPYTEGEKLFLQGQGAMYPMGVWFTAAEAAAKKDFEVGVFAIPTKDGVPYIVGSENGGGLSISKKSKQPAAALKFAKFMTFDKDAVKQSLKADGNFSNLKEPILWDMTPLQKQISDVLNPLPPMVAHYNNKVGKDPVPGIADQYNKVGQNLLLGTAGKVDLKKEMQSLDDYWDKTQKSMK